ncbi:SRPBCC domain-containing protein [Algibacter luteus]|uniref:SRPBCC domain-containing protein n=1 Tax=Algibacter luteus TaxID=1178825 RepID=UPI0025967A30|nr:SRPBCC domain-containing protein [Algibacter luteus]WJJ97018.1 SRPBCC domain-containing protein [Algibacter luteus]
MKTLKYNTTINASKEKVWNTLFTDENYPKWVSVFSEGSYAKTDWQEGSAIDFLIPSGDGMFSTIHQKIPNKLMVFNHLGFIKEGKKVYDGKSKAWENAKESYELIENNGKTELHVSMDTTDEYVNFFNETFPKALKKIKELSE